MQLRGSFLILPVVSVGQDNFELFSQPANQRKFEVNYQEEQIGKR